MPRLLLRRGLLLPPLLLPAIAAAQRTAPPPPPPPAPSMAPTPTPPPPAPALPPLVLPSGLSALPGGGWRLAFRPGEAGLPAGTAATLAEIGGRLAAATAAGHGRVNVEGQVSGPAGDSSAARRLALARALAVREALVAGGLAATRVDVRALGRTAAALDTADILPPGLPRTPR